MAAKKKEAKKEILPGYSENPGLLLDIAEKKLALSPGIPSGLKQKTPENLIHELQVHQVELEMQAEELRRTQLALTESRDQYLDLYEFAPIGYITLTATALISRANLTAAMLLGADRSKLMDARFRRWIVPEDMENWDRYFSSLLQSDKKISVTLTLKRGTKETFPARLESIRLTGNNEEESIRMAISDISDIRTAEKELRASDERLRLALVNAPVSVAIQDKDLVFQWAYNQKSTRPEDVKGKKDIDLFNPDEAQQLIDLKRKAIETGRKLREKIWLTMNGKRSFLDVYLEPMRDDTGKVTGIGVAAVDLTEQQLAEDALRQKEQNLLQAQELLELVTQGTDVIIAAQDLDYRYIFFNKAYSNKIKMLTGKELTLGTSMVELFAGIPDEQTISVKEWGKVLKGGNVNKTIEFGTSPDDRRIYHVHHTPIRDRDGKIIGAGEVAFDVTKQVQVENKLRETKEYLDNLIVYASAPIVVWDPELRITLFNRAFEELTGRKAKDVLGQNFNILLPATYSRPAMELIAKTLVGERWEGVEMPIVDRNGEIRTVLWNSAAIFGPDGRTVVSTIAQGQDITERKKMEFEFKLKASAYAKMNTMLKEEAQYRQIADSSLKNTLSLLNAALESTADGIFVVDKHGRITSYNQNFVTMWNIPLELLKTGESETVMNYVLPQLRHPDHFLAGLKELQFRKGRESFDMIEFDDGKIFERYSKPQKIGETVVGRVFSFRDITDRKRAEEKLVASVQEKEVLLREIHHRVKNNLQLISGLLDMTRMRTTDESTNSVLTDMMLKIQTMAQIHTRLYKSKQFGRINLMEQIQDQITGLSSIYSGKGHEINCTINPSDVVLPVDQAIPCALVVNEILSNAYKHAFKGRKHGTIEVSALQENGRIRITIQDDGVGIPADFDISRASSLGLKLIRTVVQHQLRGTLTFESSHGTKIGIEFPVLVAEA